MPLSTGCCGLPRALGTGMAILISSALQVDFALAIAALCLLLPAQMCLAPVSWSCLFLARPTGEGLSSWPTWVHVCALAAREAGTARIHESGSKVGG